MRPDQEQEHRIAARLRAIFGHGRRQPGSGNQAHAPNDIAIANQLHVEAKSTSAKSITVQLEWITKAAKRALLFNTPAVVAINFAVGDPHRDYFIIPDEDFYEYLELKRSANGGT